MAKINGCLKCLFIFFNVLFAIFGCLMIFGTVKSAGYGQQMAAFGGPSMGWSWVFSLGVLGISCLGIYAGASEKALALKIFAGFMAVGMIVMLIFGIIVTVGRNKIRDNFDSYAAEAAKPLMEDEGMRAMLNELQSQAQCCGIASAKDWGDEIPNSCTCRPSYNSGFGFGSGCQSRPQGTTGPDQIYSQNCAQVIFFYLDILFKICMGIFFGFAVTALMGLLVSILMIHQIRRHDNPGGASIPMKGY